MMGLRGAGFPEYANDRDDVEVAANLETVLAPMIENIRHTGVHYALEGVYLRPAFIRKMMDAAPDIVKGCVLGYPETAWQQKLADMHEYPSIANNWLEGETAEYQRQHIIRHQEISVTDRQDAISAQVAHFDTGEDYHSGLNAAFEYLVG